jgi:hypothetical protein
MVPSLVKTCGTTSTRTHVCSIHGRSRYAYFKNRTDRWKVYV